MVVSFVTHPNLDDCNQKKSEVLFDLSSSDQHVMWTHCATRDLHSEANLLEELACG